MTHKKNQYTRRIKSDTRTNWHETGTAKHTSYATRHDTTQSHTQHTVHNTSLVTAHDVSRNGSRRCRHRPSRRDCCRSPQRRADSGLRTARRLWRESRPLAGWSNTTPGSTNTTRSSTMRRSAVRRNATLGQFRTGTHEEVDHSPLTRNHTHTYPHSHAHTTTAHVWVLRTNVVVLQITAAADDEQRVVLHERGVLVSRGPFGRRGDHRPRHCTARNTTQPGMSQAQVRAGLR